MPITSGFLRCCRRRNGVQTGHSLARIWHKVHKRVKGNCQRVSSNFGTRASTVSGTDFGTELARQPFLCTSPRVAEHFGGDMFPRHTAAASSEEEGRRFFVAREFPMTGI